MTHYARSGQASPASSLPADYHLHTPLCQHAEGSPEEFFASAARKAIPEICFTDHLPSHHGYDPDIRMTMAQFPSYRRMIRRLQKKPPPPNVIFGIESDYYDRCEPFLQDWLPRQEFDLVIGSVHYLGTWAFDNPAYLDQWKTVDIASVWQRYFDTLRRMVTTGLFDVVGHLDIPKKFGHRLKDRDLRRMVNPVLDSIAGQGMVLELNTSGLRRAIAEQYPTLEVLQLARQRAIPLCFGSDAHQPDHVGYAFDRALDLARQAGYSDYARFKARKHTLVPLPGSSCKQA